jgi:hypothetical protein
MKKTYLSCFAVAVASAMLFTGCKKDSSIATDTQMAFTMQSDNSLTTLASSNQTGGGGGMTVLAATGTASVAWTSATANISKFKLNAKKSGVAFEVISSGLVNVDLMATLPSTINVTIANGTYTNVELHVVLTKSTATPPILPFVLKGTYTTKAGTTVPIEFDFNEDVELVAAANDLTIDGKNNLLAKVSLHLNKLLANITAQEVDATTRTVVNGVSTILITNIINPTLYNKIKTDLMLSSGSTIVTTAKI